MQSGCYVGPLKLCISRQESFNTVCITVMSLLLQHVLTGSAVSVFTIVARDKIAQSWWACTFQMGSQCFIRFCFCEWCIRLASVFVWFFFFYICLLFIFINTDGTDTSIVSFIWLVSLPLVRFRPINAKHPVNRWLAVIRPATPTFTLSEVNGNFQPFLQRYFSTRKSLLWIELDLTGFKIQVSVRIKEPIFGELLGGKKNIFEKLWVLLKTLSFLEYNKGRFW